MRWRGGAAVTGGLAVLAAAGLTGCDAGHMTRLDFSRTEPTRITAIVVAGGAGDVTVQTGTPDAVHIDRVVRYRGAEPGRTYRIEGTTLHIDTDCGTYCEVSYVIKAPPGVTVTGENGAGDMTLSGVSRIDVRVGAGDITVTGASGNVSVQTSAGDITATDIGGTLTARASSGDVNGRDLRSGTVRVDTDSGDIELALRTPGSIRAEAGNGDVSVRVPAGRYQVVADGDSESWGIQVQNDPTATHRIELRAGNGEIRLTQD